jgi:hypothetical protein
MRRRQLNEPLPFKDETLNGIPSGKMIDETLAGSSFFEAVPDGNN